MKFKGTKGNFSDGTIGWKVGERKTNGVDGYEIHWSDDGECVTDHVYTLEDAKLIASSPELFEACKELLNLLAFHGYTSATEISNAKQVIQEITSTL